MRHGQRMGPKQVSESHLQRRKAKLKSGGEGYMRRHAMAIEKQGSTLSPHKLHHLPGHGKQSGSVNDLCEDPGEVTTGDRVGTGTDQRACNGFMIYGMQD